MIKKGFAALAFGTLLATTAQATVFTYEQGMRNVQNAKFTYNDQTQKFSLNATLKGTANGLWAVVNQGHSPSRENSGFMHIDLQNNIITVNKGYSNISDPNASKNYNNLQVDQFKNAITYEHKNGKTFLDFTIDVTEVNDLLGHDPLGGISFNETIGGWVHVDYNPNAQYDNNDKLTSWVYGTNNHHQINGLDFHKRKTTVIEPPVPVPTPGPLALIALGLFGLYRRAKA